MVAAGIAILVFYGRFKAIRLSLAGETVQHLPLILAGLPAETALTVFDVGTFPCNIVPLTTIP